MSQTVVKPKTKVKPKTRRPPLYKVILLNDDYTPREFVVTVLKAVFRMNEEQAYNVMITAHRRGACVIAVCARRGRDQGEGSHRARQDAGLPAVFHDPAGRVERARSHWPRPYRQWMDSPRPRCDRGHGWIEWGRRTPRAGAAALRPANSRPPAPCARSC